MVKPIEQIKTMHKLRKMKKKNGRKLKVKSHIARERERLVRSKEKKNDRY